MILPRVAVFITKIFIILTPLHSVLDKQPEKNGSGSER